MESDTPAMEGKAPLVLLLIGAPGAGKSETLTRLHDDLGAAGIDSAAIDADELARSYPAIDEERQLAHLQALAGSFRRAGHDLLLIAATAESEDNLRAWFDAAGAHRRCVVHLIASPAALEERIRSREPAGWFGLPELVERTRRLASVRFADADLELNTETQGPEKVATSILTEVRRRLNQRRMSG
jgi:hypothetical protein